MCGITHGTSVDPETAPPNQGVQRTPLARPWAGRDLPSKALRLVDITPTRNLQPLLAAETPSASHVSRTRIAWYLPPASVLHPLHACQRRS